MNVILRIQNTSVGVATAIDSRLVSTSNPLYLQTGDI